MQRLVYFIFMMPVAPLLGMDPTSSSLRRDTNVIIGIANISNQGVTARIDKGQPQLVRSASMGNLIVDKKQALCHALLRRNLAKSIDSSDEKTQQAKVWIRSVTTGRIDVSPPTSPSIKHLLVVTDTDDQETLAQTHFDHPRTNTTFFVANKKFAGLYIQQIKPDDLP